MSDPRDREREWTDTDRLNWLDAVKSFTVALNPHDGRQSTNTESGAFVLLRLWHKDRGGENQSLRDAIDKYLAKASQ